MREPLARKGRRNIDKEVSKRATRCRVTHDAAQSIAKNTWTALNFNTERFDPSAMHDTSTNNTRITFGSAGTYAVGGNVLFAANDVGRRGILIEEGGSDVLAMQQVNACSTSGTGLTISTIYTFDADDYIQLKVFQGSTDALNVNQQDYYSPEFWAFKQA